MRFRKAIDSVVVKETQKCKKNQRVLNSISLIQTSQVEIHLIW